MPNAARKAKAREGTQHATDGSQAQPVKTIKLEVRLPGWAPDVSLTLRADGAFSVSAPNPIVRILAQKQVSDIRLPSWLIPAEAIAAGHRVNDLTRAGPIRRDRVAGVVGVAIVVYLLPFWLRQARGFLERLRRWLLSADLPVGSAQFRDALRRSALLLESFAGGVDRDLERRAGFLPALAKGGSSGDSLGAPDKRVQS